MYWSHQHWKWMGSISCIKLVFALSTFLSSALLINNAKPEIIIEKNLRSRDLNPGWLGVERLCYLFASRPPGTFNSLGRLIEPSLSLGTKWTDPIVNLPEQCGPLHPQRSWKGHSHTEDLKGPTRCRQTSHSWKNKYIAALWLTRGQSHKVVVEE